PVGADPEQALFCFRNNAASNAHGRVEHEKSSVIWDTQQARGLAPGMRMQGTIQNVVKYGLFVEVLPGIVGLLHVSRLAGRAPGTFSPGPIDVRIVSIDHDKQRLELALDV
ncbi:MAG: S1 RNA-binding domain-containing protein, partial [Planctomycetota bacterium]